MTVSTGPAAEAQITRLPSDLSPPPWARQWVHAKSPPHTRRADGVELTLLRGSNASLVTAAVPWASALDAQRFEQRAAQAYRCIRDLLASIPHSHPVRFWNYLPAIHEPMDALRAALQPSANGSADPITSPSASPPLPASAIRVISSSSTASPSNIPGKP